jgi:superfamily II DNA helicase RecQ
LNEDVQVAFFNTRFENMLQDKMFKERVFGLIVDLLNTWGAGFRPMFLQIGYVHARFPMDAILMGLTATLLKQALR